MNERRALCRLARLLDNHYRSAEAPAVALIANISPARTQQLTQLDALLLTEKNVALIDFKNYPDPIDGRSEEGYWFVRGTTERVRGGKSINPYQQAVLAHYRWRDFFVREMYSVIPDAANRKMLNWGHLNGFVLFYPLLHPDSEILHPGDAHKWLNFAGVDDILQLLYSNRPNLNLHAGEIAQFARDVIGAQPWPEIEQLLREFTGYLELSRVGGETVVYPLLKYDTFTIGRSRRNRVIVDSAYERVGKVHLQISTQQKSVLALDLNSRHGTFQDGELARKTLLRDGDSLTLGDASESTAFTIRFTRQLAAENPLPYTETTIG